VSDLLRKDKQGFTLIEIVLVLAIAGLIMVIVLLAVSGAQKSRRDTQRKQDVSRLFTAVGNYASNNDGRLPTSLGDTSFNPAYIPPNLKSPLTGNNYAMNGTSNTPALDQFSYRPGQNCDGGATGARSYALYIGLEQGIVCRDDN
jgi:prepilin-type N-terminal cleavage/methylation domain-containing protein